MPKQTSSTTTFPRHLLAQIWTGSCTERSPTPHPPEYLDLHEDGTFACYDAWPFLEGYLVEIPTRQGLWEVRDAHITLSFAPEGHPFDGFLERLDSEWLRLSFYGMTYHLSLLEPRKSWSTEAF